MEARAASERSRIESDLRQVFEQTLPERVERADALAQHPILPNHHFAAASAECIDLWRDGYFLAHPGDYRGNLSLCAGKAKAPDMLQASGGRRSPGRARRDYTDVRSGHFAHLAQL